MVYQFRVRRVGNDVLVLRVSDLWRAVFLLCALLLAAAGFTAERVYALPAAAAALSFLAVLYDERWTFSRSDNRVEARFGLLPVLFRRRTYSLASMERVVLRQRGVVNPGGTTNDPASVPMIPAALQKRFARLSLQFTDENGLHIAVTVQTESHRRSEYLRDLGQAVAEFCDVPFDSED